jgi:hypothetical protein
VGKTQSRRTVSIRRSLWDQVRDLSRARQVPMAAMVEAALCRDLGITIPEAAPRGRPPAVTEELRRTACARVKQAIEAGPAPAPPDGVNVPGGARPPPAPAKVPRRNGGALML